MAKILIVEDDRRIAELERDYLESGGCETVLLADGRQVIEEVEQGSYDLVLLDVIGRAEIFLICMFFYVCDLICVLFWCPFRVFLMKNRCCTTCRIFNWDHIMMFVPFVFSGGFYGLSLFAMSALVFAVWEAAFHLHPERFWERTNASLRCSQCSDVLCGRTDHKLKL